MKVPQYRQLHDDPGSTVQTRANTPSFSYPYGAMNFHGRIGN
jgi:hypothetical protein